MDQRKVDAVLLTILALGLIALLIGPSTTGYATGVQNQVSIEQMQLTTKEGIDDTLYVSATLRANRDLIDFAVSLQVDDIIVDSVSVGELADDGMTAAELSWKMKPGIHTIRVESLGSVAKKMVEVTQIGVIFKVVELEVGADEETQHFLDFAKGGIEYDVRVEEGDIIKLAFKEQTYLLFVEKVSEGAVDLRFREELISIRSATVLDLNGDEENDIEIMSNTLGNPTAQLTIKSLRGPSLLSKLLSAWWFGLIVLVLIVAIFLAYKTELLRTKHGRDTLKDVKAARREGVISESLYRKATRAIRRKLKP